MIALRYIRATSTDAAIEAALRTPDSSFVAGGTNLVDLLKNGITRTSTLVDVSRVLSATIEGGADRGVRIGAGARNADVARHPAVRQLYPVLSRALLSGASPQLRNMATVGGNLMQRTRCPYFTDTQRPCNKREPKSGCGAIEGYSRMHAILGASSQCVAVHPSDMCVALAVLDATVTVEGPSGQRRIAFSDFHRLPGTTPEADTTLGRGELVTSVDLPRPSGGAGCYLKIRDRASFAFALVSVGAITMLDGEGIIREARIALGGVAHKPWRAATAERLLIGRPATAVTFRAAAQAELAAAQPLAHNAFKVTLAERSIIRALEQTTGVRT
jgi:xanthine dehydrogenase YagS FAD-binding subunit